MANPTKKKNIIGKIKSLVEKTSNSFFSRKEPNITEDVARKIQKTDFELHKKDEKSALTPPYLTVIEQLETDDEQLFQAAAFTLANIALNEKKYAGNIISALEKSTGFDTKNDNRIRYVHDKIEKIKTHHGIA